MVTKSPALLWHAVDCAAVSGMTRIVTLLGHRCQDEVAIMRLGGYPLDLEVLAHALQAGAE